jgi:hypothetical protein
VTLSPVQYCPDGSGRTVQPGIVGHINWPLALNMEQLGMTGPPGMPMPVHSFVV